MEKIRTLTITVMTKNYGYLAAIARQMSDLLTNDPDSMVEISITKAEEMDDGIKRI